MDQPIKGNQLMRPANDVGLIGYGAYVPRFRLPASEVSRVWNEGTAALPIKEKAVPGLDEDVATMSVEAARNALARAASTRPRFAPCGWAARAIRMP